MVPSETRGEHGSARHGEHPQRFEHTDQEVARGRWRVSGIIFAPSREEGEAAKGGKYLIDFLFSQDFPVRPLDFFSLPVRHSIRLSQLDLFAEFDIRGGRVRVAALQRGVKVIFLVKRQKIIWDVLDAPDTLLCVVITLIGIGKT